MYRATLVFSRNAACRVELRGRVGYRILGSGGVLFLERH